MNTCVYVRVRIPIWERARSVYIVFKIDTSYFAQMIIIIKL